LLVFIFSNIGSKATGEEIADIAISSKDGRKLHERDLVMIPGPGATEETKERLRQMALVWEQKMNEKKEKKSV